MCLYMWLFIIYIYIYIYLFINPSLFIKYNIIRRKRKNAAIHEIQRGIQEGTKFLSRGSFIEFSFKKNIYCSGVMVWYYVKKKFEITKQTPSTTITYMFFSLERDVTQKTNKTKKKKVKIPLASSFLFNNLIRKNTSINFQICVLFIIHCFWCYFKYIIMTDNNDIYLWSSLCPILFTYKFPI